VLHATVALRLGSLDLDVDVDVADGETLALLGPNGAGKTTILRAVAGLVPLDAGRVELDGVDVTALPPSARPIGFVFQDHLLFPRLSALDNVAFGLQSRGTPKAEARRRARAWLERVEVGDHADARPGALSGGQAQRVALARALAPEPRLLLLDEPLASLDVGGRAHVRAELRRHVATFGGPRLLVTHDPLDAAVLADRVAIVEDGRITQRGTFADVASRPRSRYVADVAGVNLLHGRPHGDHTVRLATGGELSVADALPADATEVAVVVRPQSIALHAGRPGGSPRNAWPATVTDLEADRDRVRVVLGGPIPVVAEVTAAAVAELALAPGSSVWATVKAVDVDAFER
jgi:molybdate transport system ATP-binding protein